MCRFPGSRVGRSGSRVGVLFPFLPPAPPRCAQVGDVEKEERKAPTPGAEVGGTEKEEGKRSTPGARVGLGGRRGKRGRTSTHSRAPCGCFPLFPFRFSHLDTPRRSETDTGTPLLHRPPLPTPEPGSYPGTPTPTRPPVSPLVLWHYSDYLGAILATRSDSGVAAPTPAPGSYPPLPRRSETSPSYFEPYCSQSYSGLALFWLLWLSLGNSALRPQRAGRLPNRHGSPVFSTILFLLS